MSWATLALNSTPVADTVDSIPTDEYGRRLLDMGITDAQAETYGLRVLSYTETVAALGYCKGVGSIEIPYRTPDGVETGFCRYRFLGYSGRGKYVQNRAVSGYGAGGVAVYFQPGHDWLGCMSNTSEPLIITEGEFKAIAANQNRFTNCVALGGVYSFTSDAVRAAGSVLLPELSGFALRGREVYIAFDYDGTGDGEPKPEVRRAELILASALVARGAMVYFVRLWDKSRPSVKVGLDDYLKPKHLGGCGGVLVDVLKEARGRVSTEPTEGPLYKMLSEWYEYNGKAVSVLDGTLLAFDALKNKYANVFVGDYNVFDKWRSSKWRGSVVGVDFMPEHDDLLVAREGSGGLVLNTWRGWYGQVGGSGSADISMWLEFKKLLFSTDPHMEREFDLWFACLIQRPWVKQYRLPIVKSHWEGVGKSFLFESVAYAMVGGKRGLFRKYAPAKVLGPNDLADQWTDWVEGCTYAVFNEPGELGSRHTNLIKDLVTGESLRVNNKYGLKYTIQNRVNFGITTNMEYTHRFNLQSRREMVVEPPGQLLRDWRWAAMVEWRDSLGGLSAIMAYYTGYDLGDYTGKEPAPMSEAKRLMVDAGLVGWDAYISSELDGVPFISVGLEYKRALAEGCRGSKNTFTAALRRWGWSVAGTAKGQIDFRKMGLGLETVYGREDGWKDSTTNGEIAEVLKGRYLGGSKL